MDPLLAHLEKIAPTTVTGKPAAPVKDKKEFQPNKPKRIPTKRVPKNGLQ